MTKYWLVSFADSRMQGALDRLRTQAESVNIFGDRICLFTENDLDVDFRSQMANRLIPGSRGYGYWCWRPQVILQMFDKMDDGDVLLFVDAGCHIRKEGAARIRQYLDLAAKYGILAFQYKPLDEAKAKDISTHFFVEGEWCKGDVLDYFGVRNREDIVKSGQIISGVFCAKKTPSVVNLFVKSKFIAVSHYNFIDDSQSVSRNLSIFKEHRHEQSIFSILVKLSQYPTISSGEVECIGQYIKEYSNTMHIESEEKLWPKTWEDVINLPVNPGILAKRDLGVYKLFFKKKVRLFGLIVFFKFKLYGERGWKCDEKQLLSAWCNPILYFRRRNTLYVFGKKIETR